MNEILGFLFWHFRTGDTLSLPPESLLNCNFIKKRLSYTYIPVDFVIFCQSFSERPWTVACETRPLRKFLKSRCSRSSHSEVFCRKVFLKLLRISHKKNALAEVSLNKVASLQASITLLKSDSSTSVSLRFLWNFQEHLICRTPYFVGLHGCFCCSEIILKIDLKKSRLTLQGL